MGGEEEETLQLEEEEPFEKSVNPIIDVGVRIEPGHPYEELTVPVDVTMLSERGTAVDIFRGSRGKAIFGVKLWGTEEEMSPNTCSIDLSAFPPVCAGLLLTAGGGSYRDVVPFEAQLVVKDGVNEGYLKFRTVARIDGGRVALILRWERSWIIGGLPKMQTPPGPGWGNWPGVGDDWLERCAQAMENVVQLGFATPQPLRPPSRSPTAFVAGDDKHHLGVQGDLDAARLELLKTKEALELTKAKMQEQEHMQKEQSLYARDAIDAAHAELSSHNKNMEKELEMLHQLQDELEAAETMRKGEQSHYLREQAAQKDFFQAEILAKEREIAESKQLHADAGSELDGQVQLLESELEVELSQTKQLQDKLHASEIEQERHKEAQQHLMAELAAAKRDTSEVENLHTNARLELEGHKQSLEAELEVELERSKQVQSQLDATKKEQTSHTKAQERLLAELAAAHEEIENQKQLHQAVALEQQGHADTQERLHEELMAARKEIEDRKRLHEDLHATHEQLKSNKEKLETGFDSIVDQKKELQEQLDAMYRDRQAFEEKHRNSSEEYAELQKLAAERKAAEEHLRQQLIEESAKVESAQRLLIESTAAEKSATERLTQIEQERKDAEEHLTQAIAAQERRLAAERASKEEALAAERASTHFSVMQSMTEKHAAESKAVEHEMAKKLEAEREKVQAAENREREAQEKLDDLFKAREQAEERFTQALEVESSEVKERYERIEHLEMHHKAEAELASEHQAAHQKAEGQLGNSKAEISNLTSKLAELQEDLKAERIMASKSTAETTEREGRDAALEGRIELLEVEQKEREAEMENQMKILEAAHLAKDEHLRDHEALENRLKLLEAEHNAKDGKLRDQEAEHASLTAALREQLAEEQRKQHKDNEHNYENVVKQLELKRNEEVQYLAEKSEEQTIEHRERQGELERHIQELETMHAAHRQAADSGPQEMSEVEQRLEALESERLARDRTLQEREAEHLSVTEELRKQHADLESGSKKQMDLLEAELLAKDRTLHEREEQMLQNVERDGGYKQQMKLLEAELLATRNHLVDLEEAQQKAQHLQHERRHDKLVKEPEAEFLARDQTYAGVTELSEELQKQFADVERLQQKTQDRDRETCHVCPRAPSEPSIASARTSVSSDVIALAPPCLLEDRSRHFLESEMRNVRQLLGEQGSWPSIHPGTIDLPGPPCAPSEPSVTSARTSASSELQSLLPPGSLQDRSSLFSFFGGGKESPRFDRPLSRERRDIARNNNHDALLAARSRERADFEHADASLQRPKGRVPGGMDFSGDCILKEWVGKADSMLSESPLRARSQEKDATKVEHAPKPGTIQLGSNSAAGSLPLRHSAVGSISKSRKDFEGLHAPPHFGNLSPRISESPPPLVSCTGSNLNSSSIVWGHAPCTTVSATEKAPQAFDLWQSRVAPRGVPGLKEAKPHNQVFGAAWLGQQIGDGDIAGGGAQSLSNSPRLDVAQSLAGEFNGFADSTTNSPALGSQLVRPLPRWLLQPPRPLG